MSNQLLQLNITLGINTPINTATEVNSIQIIKHRGKHDEALINIRLQQFGNNQHITSQFVIGGMLKIELGYATDPLTSVFEGEIKSFGIQANDVGTYAYTIEAIAASVNLTHTVPNKPAQKYAFGVDLLAMDFSCNQNQETAGHITVQGNADITIGELLQISATESFADKPWLITGLIHQIHEGNWFTKAYLS